MGTEEASSEPSSIDSSDPLPMNERARLGDQSGSGGGLVSEGGGDDLSGSVVLSKTKAKGKAEMGEKETSQ
jgi:hypothetical protein